MTTATEHLPAKIRHFAAYLDEIGAYYTIDVKEDDLGRFITFRGAEKDSWVDTSISTMFFEVVREGRRPTVRLSSTWTMGLDSNQTVRGDYTQTYALWRQHGTRRPA